MFDFVWHLFDTSAFPPRWYCGEWSAAHGWLHVLSDLAIWSAYFAIPCLLVYFARRRMDVPFRSLFWLFSAFILACGTTHLMEAVIFWWPAYRLAAVIKLATACFSWATIAALIPTIPKALALRSPQELEDEVQKRTEELGRGIVERKRLEAILRRQAELLDLAPVLAIDWQSRIIVWTSGAEEMYGWTTDQALGCVSHDLLGTQFSEPLDEIRRQLLESGTWKGELRQHRRDGSPIVATSRWVLYRETPASSPVILEINSDITQRLEMEQALREADRRKDEFLAMLGHELRNPLAAIQGGVSLLRLPGIDAPARDAAKEILAQQTDHMVRLVDDLLDVSRIVLGKVEIRKQAVTLQRALGEAIEMTRPMIEANRCRFETLIPAEPIPLCADPVRLAQVFGNLLNNAAKYSPNCLIQVRVEVPNGEAVVHVRDWGIGIRPELIDHMFDLFVQPERSLARSEGGLGIGLTVVKSLVEMHGGRVEAFSEGEGQGSDFVVHLPLADQQR